MTNKTKKSTALTTQSPKDIKYSLSSSPSPSQQYSQSQWQNTIKSIAPAVLIMEMTYAIEFEGIPAYRSLATAFVVDKTHGIAVTNRHCAADGPATFSLGFISGEQVPAYRIYTNPSHDFAFVKFDPSLIEYMELAEIELHPEGAQHGVEILIAGNDSREKFLTCRGVINKLEFIMVEGQDIANAFYTRANIVTRGGASGSPVVNINGKAVGINANSGHGDGGFVPLDKVVPVLEILKHGFDNYGNWRPIKIPRKTLGASFVPSTLERLTDDGIINEEDSLSIAKKYGNTLFLVENLSMKSQLEENDLLLELNGLKLGDLVEVETILNEIDEEFVTLKVARYNDSLKRRILKAKVFDMEDERTCEIFDVSGSSIYKASFSSALRNKIVVGSLLVDKPGACFEVYMNKTSVLKSINGQKITCFNDFLDGLEISVLRNNLLKFNIQNDSKEITMTAYREFYKWCCFAFIWHFSKDTFKWTRETIELLRLSHIDFGIARQLGEKYEHRDKSFSLTAGYPANRKPVCMCLVGVSYRIPDYIDNINNVRSHNCPNGTGIVIYQSSEIGIVLTTQPTVPLIVGGAVLDINPALSVIGVVFFVDTNRGFSLIYYNPRFLGRYSDKIAPAKLSPNSVAFNDRVQLLCQDKKREEPVSVYCRLKLDDKDVDHDPDIPCDKESDPDITCDISHNFGLIVDNDLKVKALSLNISEDFEIKKLFSMSSIIKPLDLIMKSMLSDPQGLCYEVRLPVFQAKLKSVTVEEAIKMGLGYGSVNKILHKPRSERRFLMVKYCLPESNVAQSLKPEDLILSINRKHVSSMEDMEEHLFGKWDLNIRILRDAKAQNVRIQREFISKPPNIRVVFWCGLLVQDTPRDLDFNKGFTPRRGIVINRSDSFNRGEPSELNDGCCWITEVNGTKVRNLDEFLQVTTMLSDGEDVLCKLIAWNGKTIAFNYTLDYLHLPMVALTFDEVKQLWTQEEISPKPRTLTS